MFTVRHSRMVDHMGKLYFFVFQTNTICIIISILFIKQVNKSKKKHYESVLARMDLASQVYASTRCLQNIVTKSINLMRNACLNLNL